MIRKHPQLIFLLLISYFVFLSSCKKDSFITSPDASLSTSVDSLKFDTVFTSVGSITQIFKINNNNNQKLLLNQVKLAGGDNSAFTININGITGPVANNISIDANDSIYVFVTVTVNPNNQNLPFIISDSVLINYNSNIRSVQLQAYGQNAHFLTGETITGNTNWPNDLPYVILGGVQVDTTATLTIEKGCRIYSHANAPFIVDGTLIINGTKQENVVFTGDRLDVDYKDLPASWPGIYFRTSSTSNVLTHTVIKNAFQGLVVDSLSTNAATKLTLHQCIIDNAYDAGILCYNGTLDADNSLISNCGSNVELFSGGQYNFINCTVASYGNLFIAHKNAVLQVTDYDASTGTAVIKNLNALFQNCIFWGDYGNVDDEVLVDAKGTYTIPPVTFDHILYKVKNDPANVAFQNTIQNTDPKFDSIDVNRMIFDFHTTQAPSAPGIDSGTLTTSYSQDLDGNPRKVGAAVDLGCYEKQ